MTKLYYCAVWDSPKERTWSGTTWHLRKALARHFEIVDYEVPKPGLVQRALGRIRRSAGHGNMGLTAIKDGSERFWASFDPQPGDVVFSFDECPMPRKLQGVLHYVYQDLCVEYIYRAKDGGLPIAGFPHATADAMKQRLDNQNEFYARAAGVFTMGEWMADYLVRACGLPAEKVHHVGGGSNLPDAAGAAGHVCESDAPVFLFVGRDFKRKGGPDVLAAFACVRKRVPGARLIIAGPFADPRGDEDENVDYFGDCSNEKVAELLDQADVFVMPSHFEAYGIVFAEALSRGVPCVGRDICEMPFFIHDGENGALVRSNDACELAEAMMQCVNDERIRDTAAREADAARRMYSWDAVAQRIAWVIEGDLAKL